MGALFVSNAFSLGMLSSDATIRVTEVDTLKAKEVLSSGNFTSAIGHLATADVVSNLLNVKVEANRVPIKLQKGDTILIFQLLTRLEEGKVLNREELEKIQYKFFLVEIL